MAEHWVLMTGRLITESTLRSAIHEPFADADVACTTAGYEQADPSVVPEDVQLRVGKAKSGVMVECRICQEEGDEAYMETPCSCKGSLKYAHHRCVQRWCDEKGDTICEICLQQLTPNYTAPLKLFRRGRNLMNFRRAVERRANHSSSYSNHTSDQSDVASSSDPQSSNPKGIMFCRVFAVVLMALLVFRDAVLLILRSHEVCSIELITLMFRTVGIIIPIYVILIAVTTLLHQCNQRHAVNEMPVSDPRGAGDLQPVPPQQQQHIINIQ